jgi:hypothetical protein
VTPCIYDFGTAVITKRKKDCVRIQDDMSYIMSEVPSVMDVAATVCIAITLAFGT